MNAPTALPQAATASQRREREMVTPEGIAIPVTIASRGSRLGALIIDFTIITAAIVAVVLLLVFTGIGLFEQIDEIGTGSASSAAEFLLVIFIIFAFLSRYGYFLAFELGPRGATLGKRAVGIRVAARGGGRLTPEAVVARNLTRDIELFLPLGFFQVAPGGEMGAFGFAGLAWFAMFMAFPFFNRDCLRAGDIIAGTWVLEAPREKLADTLSSAGAAREGTSDVTGTRYDFGEAELSVYGEHELQTLERLLRDAKPGALAQVHETICRKIGWDPGAGDERAFLEAFYAQLRARLEGNMRFGKRKADKHS